MEKVSNISGTYERPEAEVIDLNVNYAICDVSPGNNEDTGEENW